MYRFDAHFRDSHMDQDGVESVVHDTPPPAHSTKVGGRVIDIGPEAMCSRGWSAGAVASAERLSGSPSPSSDPGATGVTGTSSCTHLNDTLRSLGDLEVPSADVGPTLRHRPRPLHTPTAVVGPGGRQQCPVVSVRARLPPAGGSVW